MAEWSKALVLGTSLRAWVRIPLQSRQLFIFVLTLSYLYHAYQYTLQQSANFEDHVAPYQKNK